MQESSLSKQLLWLAVVFIVLHCLIEVSIVLFVVRLCEDKLSLIRQVLELTSSAYKKKQKVQHFFVLVVVVNSALAFKYIYQIYVKSIFSSGSPDSSSCQSSANIRNWGKIKAWSCADVGCRVCPSSFRLQICIWNLSGPDGGRLCFCMEYLQVNILYVCCKLTSLSCFGDIHERGLFSRMHIIAKY